MKIKSMPKGAKILICEDVFLNFFVLQKLINNLYPDLVIVHAIDGVEGLKEFENHQFDLIVTDIEMPNMDGWEFIEHIKQKGYNTDKIVVISAQIEQMLSEEANKLGVKKYYSKPLATDTVKEITDIILV